MANLPPSMPDKMPERMFGVILKGHGDLDQLEYRNDLALPDMGHHDVLIKVEAAGVNNTDINTRTAWYSKGDGDSDDASWSGQALQFPRIQGADVCGTIVAVGDSVEKDRIGQRVLIEPCIREAQGKTLETPWYFGSECNGGFAEYAVVSNRHAYKVTSTLESHELASFPCSYSTAENMLTRARVQPHDRVLITGASGGVGSAAIQLAKARGASVIAITSPSKADEILEIGADQVLGRDVNYAETLGANSVDVVIDLVAGDAFPTLLEVMKSGGRYAVAGAIGGPLVELDVRTLYLKDLSFFGCTVLEPKVFGNLVKLIEENKIKPLVAETYPLSEIATAQTSFEQKKHIGKIVLNVRDNE
ncbi:alcohol dehydrogenase family protein [Kiloniella majae]|uniref:alcohol dehydrogenase family protein n=1 Tax=Kiloniella majae TaxID=1938558 RepID=UPI001C3FE4EB|nr:alcohol dehydrogenase family protein [Kiloniella majae]